MEETIRILVVDDEPDIRRICRILLENSGYTVLEAATGLEAVETIRRCPEIDRTLRPWEWEECLAMLEESSVSDGFVQELSAAGEEEIPAFDGTGVK